MPTKTNKLLFMGSTLFLLLFSSACNTTDTTPPVSQSEIVSIANTTEADEDVFRKNKKLNLENDFKLISLSEIEIIPAKKDSMLYHVSFELSPNLYITVAQPMQDTKEGVRLELQKKTKKGKLKVLASSSPGYDSPQLYPTFFKNKEGDYIILANTGISDSWGIKVYSLIGKHFYDLGYIDMALIEKRAYPDEDGKMEKYSNLSPHTRITADGNKLTFSFDAKKIMLFEDLDGQREISVNKDDYYYTYDNKSFVLQKK